MLKWNAFYEVAIPPAAVWVKNYLSGRRVNNPLLARQRK